jgi:hypothetical protein
MSLRLSDLKTRIADQRLKMSAQHMKFLDQILLRTPEFVVVESGKPGDHIRYHGWIIAKDLHSKRAIVICESPWIKKLEWFVADEASLKNLSLSDCPSFSSLTELIATIIMLNKGPDAFHN